METETIHLGAVRQLFEIGKGTPAGEMIALFQTDVAYSAQFSNTIFRFKTKEEAASFFDEFTQRTQHDAREHANIGEAAESKSPSS